MNPRKKTLTLVTSLIAALFLFVGVALAMNTVVIDGDTQDWTDEYCLVDEMINSGSSVVDDETNQNDITRGCVGSNFADTDPNPATILYLAWNWDDTGFPGANTGDGCFGIDVNLNGNVDYAICVSIGEDGSGNLVGTPALYSCSDTKPDRCGAPNSNITGSWTGSCGLDTINNVTEIADPFAADPNHSSGNTCVGTDCVTLDTVAECSLPLSDVGIPSGGQYKLIFCSYPSGQPGSNPNDCLLNISTDRFYVNADTGGNGRTSPTAITLKSLSAAPDTGGWTILGLAALTLLLAVGGAGLRLALQRPPR